MHETAVIQSLLEQVRTFVPDDAKLLEVQIEIGRLEHLDPDVLQTAWTAFTDRTDLAGSVLVITVRPLRLRCRACGHEFSPEDPALLICPGCASVRPEVLEGSGILLRSLEVDQPVVQEEA